MSKSDRAPRRRSRQAALQALYAGDLSERGREDSGDCIEDVFDRVTQNFDLPAGAREFALALVQGTASHRQEIDSVLSEHATNWKISRMAAVDRNILRLGIFELIQTDTPVSIVLEEAIQLARRFGGESSPVFVNGVLDSVARQVRPKPDGDVDRHMGREAG
jgi:N utilization substance protein B